MASLGLATFSFVRRGSRELKQHAPATASGKSLEMLDRRRASIPGWRVACYTEDGVSRLVKKLEALWKLRRELWRQWTNREQTRPPGIDAP